MAHLGVITIEASGHLNPMTTLARELKRRGHQLTVLGLPDGRAKVQSAGLEFVEMAGREFPLGSMPQALEQIGSQRGRAALNSTFDLYTRKARAILRCAPDAIRDAAVDGLLIDQYALGAGSVADMLGIPYVVICNAFAVNREPAIPPVTLPWPYARTALGRLRNEIADRFLIWLTSPIRNCLNEQRRLWGLPPDRAYDETTTGLATIAQQPRCFDFPRHQLPANFHFAGPFHDPQSGGAVDFPYERLNGKPILYASMGTVQNQLQPVFRTIAAACQGLDVQLVLTLGRRDAAFELPDAGSAIVVPYAPQLELIPRSAAVLSHGGMNTVLESLSHGVPLVVVPITNDQPAIAARVAHHGVGEVVRLSRLGTARLRTAIARVLLDPGYRSRARAMQAEIARTSGLQRAAEIIERAFETRKPVIRADREG